MTTFVGATQLKEGKQRILGLVGTSFGTTDTTEMVIKLRNALETSAAVLNDMTPVEVPLNKVSYILTPSLQNDNLTISVNITTRKVEDFKASYKYPLAVSADGSFDGEGLAEFVEDAYYEIISLRSASYNAKLIEETFKKLSGDSNIKLAFVVSAEKAPRDIQTILEDETVVLNVQDLGVEANGSLLDDVIVASNKEEDKLTTYEKTILNKVIEDFENAESVVSFIASFKDYLHPFLASKTGKMAVNSAKGYFLRSYSSKYDWLEGIKSTGRTAKVEEIKDGDEVKETHITLFERRNKDEDLVQVLPTFIAETKLFV